MKSRFEISVAVGGRERRNSPNELPIERDRSNFFIAETADRKARGAWKRADLIGRSGSWRDNASQI
jgi:hypothetical protein